MHNCPNFLLFVNSGMNARPKVPGLKMKIYLVKNIKMKIQNKYVFRTIISVFLYIYLKKMHGFGIIARSRCLGQDRPGRGSAMAARPKAHGSSMFIWIW